MKRDPASSIANQIVKRVTELGPYQSARIVCCYVALPDEVPTRVLIERCWADGKTVLVPKVTGPSTMVPICLDRWDELAPGAFGVFEPHATGAYTGRIDVMVVPGRLFSVQGDRQGRGRGYYDRFLAQYPEATKIGLASESQVVDILPTEPHDIRMMYVVTQKRTLGPFHS